MVRQLGNVHEVVGHAGHDLARLMGVKKAEGEHLKPPEEIGTHLCLNAHAHHVSLILDEVIQKHANDVQHQQEHAAEDDQTVASILRVSTGYKTPMRDTSSAAPISAANRRRCGL